jgi:hypothetical protein
MAATTYIPVAETAGDDEKGEVEACSVDYDESSDNSGPRLETSKGKFIFLIIGMSLIHEKANNAYYKFQRSSSRTLYAPNSTCF